MLPGDPAGGLLFNRRLLGELRDVHLCGDGLLGSVPTAPDERLRDRTRYTSSLPCHTNQWALSGLASDQASLAAYRAPVASGDPVSDRQDWVVSLVAVVAAPESDHQLRDWRQIFLGLALILSSRSYAARSFTPFTPDCLAQW